MGLEIKVLQVVVALGIFNVWILRRGKATGWRGGAAKNMEEEFEVYGLPTWSVQVIGFLKLLFALCLVAGLWLSELTRPAAVGLAILMSGAILMHLKVKDGIKKSLPAITVLALCLIIALA
jgi:uncharacterized membrane protein YphA (DoxX/SURF4 family)